MDVTLSQIAAGLGLTAIAGLATGVGSCIAFFAKKQSTRFLSCALGFSGGVMIYISLVELLAGSQMELSEIFGKRPGSLAGIAAFFGCWYLPPFLFLIPGIMMTLQSIPLDKAIQSLLPEET